MQTFLESFIPWGYQVLQSIQQWSTPWLDTFFRIFTRLGDAEGYLLLLPMMYWCLDARFGRRMSIGILYVLLLNAAIKLTFVIPRPSATKIRLIGHATGPSFPSGHAQGVMTLAAYLGRFWKHTGFWIFLVIFTLLIGFSRLYLGVHFPQDILGGWLLALLGLLLIWNIEAPLAAWLARQSFWTQLLVSLPLPLLVFFGMKGASRVPAAAAVLGFSVGLALERRFVRFSSDGPSQHRMLRYLAIIPLGLIMYGLKKIFPEGDVSRLLRYSLLGLFGTFVAPWCFIKLGIAQKELPPAPSA